MKSSTKYNQTMATSVQFIENFEEKFKTKLDQIAHVREFLSSLREAEPDVLFPLGTSSDLENQHRVNCKSQDDALLVEDNVCGIFSTSREISLEQNEVISDKINKLESDLSQCNISDSATNGADRLRLLYERSAKRLYKVAAVRRFRGREDCGYERNDFENVAQKATLCMNCFEILLKKLNLMQVGGSVSLNRVHKSLLKLFSLHGILICLEHLELDLWTTEESVAAANSLLSTLLQVNCCQNLQELFCGKDSIETLPSSCLFYNVLSNIQSRFEKTTWKQNPAVIPVYSRCLLAVRFPLLSSCVDRILPPALLLVDDFQLEHKLLGVKCLQHIMENVSGTELSWYGRADVLYEALQHQMYTRDESLIPILHPCLLKVLKVVENKPRHGGKYDDILDRLLADMELENSLIRRRAYSMCLPLYIRAMGISVVKHIQRLLAVLFEYLQVYDGPDEIARINALEATEAMICGAWPRMPAHCEMILKALLRFVYDVCMDDTVNSIDTNKLLLDRATNCLILLKRTSPNKMQPLLSQVDGVFDNDLYQKCVRTVLESN